MLAAYLVWHLRRAWTPLTYTDQHPPDRDNPGTMSIGYTNKPHKTTQLTTTGADTVIHTLETITEQIA